MSSVVTIESRHASRSWRIFSGGPIKRQLLKQLGRDRRRRLVLMAGQVQILDRRHLGLIAHADRHVGVEVGSPGAHPAEVQRVHRPQRVGR